MRISGFAQHEGFPCCHEVGCSVCSFCADADNQIRPHLAIMSVVAGVVFTTCIILLNEL